jgi:hypothetical protein
MQRDRIANKVRETTPDLARAVGRILGQCLGHDKALSLESILGYLHSSPVYARVTVRQLRSCLEDLRAGGQLVCSDSEGGHWLAGSLAEYQDFRRFYASYAKTIFERLAKMDKAAEQRFKGAALQDRLI